MSTLALKSKKPAAHGRIRVLAIIPGEAADRSSMVFARRQMNAIAQSEVDVHVFFLSSRTSLRVLVQEFRRFRKTVSEFDPHIVHAHYGTITALFSALASYRPLVITFRGSDLNPTSDIGYIRSLVGRVCSQIAVFRAKHVICVSEQLRNQLWSRRCPTSVIFDGVNLSLFYPIPKDKARQTLEWDSKKKFVFFNLGGRPAGKRLALAESAIKIASREVRDIELIKVSKVDPERIPLLMNACDCLLLTSDWEGSPTVVKEAMACELPVVSVDVGDVSALLDGVLPSRVVPDNSEAIGRALVEILRKGVRSNGTMRVQPMSEESTTSKVLDIYQRILA